MGTEPGREFQNIDDTAHAGRWKVAVFWPMGFTFVCPTELVEFGQRAEEFRARGAEVLGVNTDTRYARRAWRRARRSSSIRRASPVM